MVLLIFNMDILGVKSFFVLHFYRIISHLLPVDCWAQHKTKRLLKTSQNTNTIIFNKFSLKNISLFHVLFLFVCLSFTLFSLSVSLSHSLSLSLSVSPLVFLFLSVSLPFLSHLFYLPIYNLSLYPSVSIFLHSSIRVSLHISTSSTFFSYFLSHKFIHVSQKGIIFLSNSFL